jgi:hypothetical protein
MKSARPSRRKACWKAYGHRTAVRSSNLQPQRTRTNGALTAPYSEKLRPARRSRHSDPFRSTRSGFLKKLISKMRRIVDAQQIAQFASLFADKRPSPLVGQSRLGRPRFRHEGGGGSLRSRIKGGRSAGVRKRIHSECKRAEPYSDAWSEDRMLGQLAPGAMGEMMIGGHFATVPAGSP